METETRESAQQNELAADASTGNPEQLLRKIAEKPKSASPEEMQSALDWFLSDEEVEDGAEPHYRLEIDVSTNPDVKKYVPWVVKPLQSTRIDMLRRHFQVAPAGNRQQRRRAVTGDLDAAKFNAALVYEGTVDPDLEEVVKRKKMTDGAALVLHRFRFKPLLVDQIAGEILAYSGGDDEAVRLVTEVKAASG